MRFVGIDVSHDKLDCAIVDEPGRLLHRARTFRNSPAGVAQLMDWARLLADETECQFILEATAAYHELVAYQLHEAALPVSVINAAHARSLARGLAMLSKTDMVDCVALAHFGRLARPRLWRPASKAVAELQALLLRLDAIEADLRRETNRMEQASIRGSSPVVMHSLADSITFLKQQKQRLERAIQAQVAAHAEIAADVEHLQSIPAVGEKTARRMAVLLRTNTFKSAREAAAFLGLVPVEHTSGTSVRKPARLSKAGNPRMRAGLYMAAVVAKGINPDVRALYERLVKNGKSKMQALGACMRKLVHICFGVHRSGIAYSSQPRVLP